MQARRAEIPGKNGGRREEEGGGRRPGGTALRHGLGAARGWPSGSSPLLAAPARRGAALLPGPVSAPPRPAPLGGPRRTQPRRQRTGASRSRQLSFIGTNEQPAPRAREACQRPRGAATSCCRGEEAPRGERIRDAPPTPQKRVLPLQGFYRTRVKCWTNCEARSHPHPQSQKASQESCEGHIILRVE